MSLCRIDVEDQIGTVHIDSAYYVKPKGKEQINLLIADIANEIAKAIIESQKYGNNTFNVRLYSTENLRTKNLDFAFCKGLADVLKAMYPDKLQRCYIHNASKLIKNLYMFIEPLLDEPTRKKLVIVKDEKAD